LGNIEPSNSQKEKEKEKKTKIPQPFCRIRLFII
jgi:hypothetical protein